jgi:hypothetical protein
MLRPAPNYLGRQPGEKAPSTGQHPPGQEPPEQPPPLESPPLRPELDGIGGGGGASGWRRFRLFCSSSAASSFREE